MKVIFESPTCPGLGTTPDFLARDAQGLLVVEIKSHRYSRWLEQGEQPSMSAELQLQAQMLCMNINRGALVCWVDGGGDQPIVFYREAHEASQKRIMGLVEAFWRRVKDQDPPEVSQSSDLGRLPFAYEPEPEEVIDLSSDPEANQMLAEYMALSDQAKASKSEADNQR